MSMKVKTTDIEGLGGAALLNVGAVVGTVAAGDDSRFADRVKLDAGGVNQEILNQPSMILTNTPASVQSSLAPAVVNNGFCLYRSATASVMYIVSSGAQAGTRALSYGNLTNNRFIRYGGTLGAATNIATNDVISDLNSYGLIALSEAELSRIRTEYYGADPSVTTNRATRMRFFVGRDGSTAMNEAFRLEYQMLTAYGTLAPSADNTFNLGSGSFRWGTVYAATGTINTSDERLKRDIQDPYDDLLDAWGSVNWVAYRFKDAYETKGEEARWHFGLLAQQVRDAIDAVLGEGKAVRLGLVCYDSWDAQDEITRPVMGEREIKVPMRDAEGLIVIGEYRTESEEYDTGEIEIVQEAREAGDRWGLRYDECFALEAAWQRREIERLKAGVLP